MQVVTQDQKKSKRDDPRDNKLPVTSTAAAAACSFRMPGEAAEQLHMNGSSKARTVALSLNLNVDLPLDIPSSEEELKEWVWKHHSDQIRQSLCIAERNPMTKTPTASEGLAAAAEEETTPRLKNSRENLLDTIAHVQRQFFQSAHPKVVFGYLLEGLLELTSSEYGFIGEIKYEGQVMFLQSHAITNIAWNQATQQFYEDNIESGLKFYNLDTLFGTVMTTQKPVISNDPSSDPRAGGIPEGHPPLNHFLGLPFFYKGKMTGMVGISNKPGGYAQSDIEFLEPLMVTCSNLIQAFQQIKQNDYLIHHLEESVVARTRELVEVNRNLEQANRQVRQNAVMQMQHFACMSHEIRTPLNCIIGTCDAFIRYAFDFEELTYTRLGMSSLIKDTKMTPMQAESMKMIIASGDLLLAIVNDVLDYAKLETDHVEINVMRSDLQDMLQSIIYSIEMKARDRGQSMKTIYDPHLPVFVNTDIRRIQQILFNLLGNAVKFSKDNGVIELAVRYEIAPDEAHEETTHGEESKVSEIFEQASTSNQHLNHDANSPTPPRCPFKDATSSPDKAPSNNPGEDSPSSGCPFHKATSSPQSEASAATPVGKTDHHPIASSHPRRLAFTKSNLIFTVTDYGKGIDRSDFDSIFQPFQQVAGVQMDTVHGGTGLGLAITKKLVEALGGTISVDSEFGSWSKFTVVFPCSDAPAPVDELAKKLSDATIVMIGLPTSQKENVLRVFQAFQLDVRLLDQLDESALTHLLSSIAQDQRIICLIHGEDNDDVKPTASWSSVISAWRETNNGRNISIFTVGAHTDNHVNGNTDARHHIRSLEQVIPQALIEILDEKSSKSTSFGEQSDSDSEQTKPKIQKEVLYQDLRVLIAEDNKINQKVLLRMLQRLKINNVDVVDNGRDAVEREATCPYDVILMDQQMPIMGGVPACRAIVSRNTGSHPIPHVIFVTAHVSVDFENECRAAGCSGFLPKPFKVGDIDKTFREIAERIAGR